MKSTKLWRLLEKALFIIIFLLSMLIAAIVISKSLPTPADPKVSSAQTSGTGTVTADGFTTVFTLAENASQAAKDYQEGTSY